MKKLLLLILLSVLYLPLHAQEESRMFLHPGREVFVNFPSEVLGLGHHLTVYLPEKQVPLSRKYPVLYVLGADTKSAAQADLLNSTQNQKVIVVGITFDEKDYEDADKIARFFSRELIPYIDTNYLTFNRPSGRMIAGRGSYATKALIKLASMPELFDGVVMTHPSDDWSASGLRDDQRILVRGGRASVAYAQKVLEGRGLEYGTNFALRFVGENEPLFSTIAVDYLLASPAELGIKKVVAKLSDKTLPLGGKTFLTVTALLDNGMRFDVIPVSLRMSPPFLRWQATQTALQVISGAETGRVKISGRVGKKPFSVKIKLKKQ